MKPAQLAVRVAWAVVLGMFFCEVFLKLTENIAPTSSALEPVSEFVHRRSRFAQSTVLPTFSASCVANSSSTHHVGASTLGQHRVSSTQRVSCFPTADVDWANSSCGLFMDGVSVAGFINLSDYRRHVGDLVQELLVYSSAHLPHFDVFPRVLVVLDFGVTAAVEQLINRTAIAVAHADCGTIASCNDVIRLSHEARSKSARVLLVITLAHVCFNPSSPCPNPFEVMQWSPFERTMFVNASSFGIPSVKRVTPPTLLLSLLDYYHMLLVPIPYMEEMLWRVQRAGCWPIRFDDDTLVGSVKDSEDLYVGALYHTGFLLYTKKAPAVRRLFALAAARFRTPRPALNVTRMYNRMHSACHVHIWRMSFWWASFALHDALQTLDASALCSKTDMMMLKYTTVDPIHCADFRLGLDPCNRITNRPSRMQKKERSEMFRCDNFRL